MKERYILTVTCKKKKRERERKKRRIFFKQLSAWTWKDEEEKDRTGWYYLNCTKTGFTLIVAYKTVAFSFYINTLLENLHQFFFSHFSHSYTATPIFFMKFFEVQIVWNNKDPLDYFEGISMSFHHYKK